VAAAVIAALGLPVLGGISGPHYASAADFSTGDTVFVDTDALRLRDAPSTDGNIVDVLLTNETGVVTDGPETADGYDWYELDVDGVGSGWVAGDFLGLSAADDPGFDENDVVEVIDGSLNLRESAGLSADVLEVLDEGTELTIVSGPENADGIAWYEVTADDLDGWVAGGFLQLVEDGTPTDPDFDAGSILLVNSDNLNLRDEAGLSGSPIGQLMEGDEAVVVSGPVEADGYTWYELDTDLGTGWSVDDFLTDTGNQDDGSSGGEDDLDQIEIGAVVKVVDGELNLRESAGTGGTLITTLADGTELTVTDGPFSADGYTWFEVNGDDGLGWVAGEFLDVVTPAETSAATATT
jgi:uncharacterized protein YgiM (DUF1202 family)